MPNYRGRLRALALALAVPLIVTSCGSDNASDDAGGSKDSGDSGETIKIGLAIAQTGSSAPLYAGGAETAEAWVKAVNERGGINGQQVELVVKDTQSTPTSGQAAVTELVDQEKVDALMMADDSTTGAVSDYLVGENIAVIGENGFDTSTWGAKPNFFTQTTLPPYTTTAELIAAQAVDASKVGAVVCAEFPDCKKIGDLLEPSADALGLEYTGLATAAGDAAGYTAECVSLMDEGSDEIILALSSATASRVIADCTQQGYDGWFGISSLSVDMSVLEKLSDARINGDVSAFPWWADAEPVAAFREAMEKYAPDANFRSNSSTGTWTALAMFEKAVTASGQSDVTRESVLEAYYQVKDETLDGLLPEPVTYTEGEPAPTIKAAWVFTYESGDEDPTTVVPDSPCNGASGDLASTCQE